MTNRSFGRRPRKVAGVIAAFVAVGCVALGASLAGADITFPRSEVRRTVDDAKSQAKDAKNGAKSAVEDAKKQAKDAVDEALDGGLAADGGRDGGDAGDADASSSADEDDARESAKRAESRAERAGHSRETARRELAAAGSPPMDDAIRDELRVHAKRVAWLDRIGWLASRADDRPSQSLVRRLLTDEFTRHTSWLAEHAKAGNGP